VITHPEKVLFPDSAITKGELCAYYEAVAPLMIPLRTAELAVRELLDEFGLPSYVKTSGSKASSGPTWTLGGARCATRRRSFERC
jgi:DNA primase